MLEGIEPYCRVTRLKEMEHLRASHIKPWREASDEERLDGNNGLLLAPHIDHLFDRGYISFSDEGDVLLSASLSKEAATALGVAEVDTVGSFNAKQRVYLAYHREKVFIQTS